MVASTTPGIDNFLKLNDPNYREGYEKGYESCRREVIEELQSLLNKIKKLEAYKKYTGTASIK